MMNTPTLFEPILPWPLVGLQIAVLVLQDGKTPAILSPEFSHVKQFR